MPVLNISISGKLACESMVAVSSALGLESDDSFIKTEVIESLGARMLKLLLERSPLEAM